MKCLYDEINNSYLLKYTTKLLVLQEGSRQKTIFKFIFLKCIIYLYCVAGPLNSLLLNSNCTLVQPQDVNEEKLLIKKKCCQEKYKIKKTDTFGL